MKPSRIEAVLRQLSGGEKSVDEVLQELRVLPFEDVADFARLDHHREMRVGTPEVVFGSGKTVDQIVEIMAALAETGGGALATRVDADKAASLMPRVPGAVYHERARAVEISPAKPRDEGQGVIAIVCAGTSDLPVASEAAVVANFLGHRTEMIPDVGVAGLHRLLDRLDQLRRAQVIIAVAGMEGALPTVLSGLVARPIIAVPTSVGYGVGVGGYVAMMGMLASCSPGVSVVNIDNGFGAAVAAARINRRGSA